MNHCLIAYSAEFAGIIFKFLAAMSLVELIVWRGETHTILIPAAGFLFISQVLADLFCYAASSDRDKQRFPLRLIMRLLFSLCLFASTLLLEQGIGSHLTVWIAVVGLLIVSPVLDPGENTPPFSSLFTLVVAGLIAFNSAAALDQSEYFELGGKILPSLQYGDWIAGLTLIILLVAVVRRTALSHVDKVISIIVAVCGLSFIVLTLWGRQHISLGGISAAKSGQFALANTCVMIIGFLGVNCHRNIKFRRFSLLFIRGIFAVIFLGLVASATYSLALLRKPISDTQIQFYKISQNFLLPLLTAEDPRFFRHSGVDYHRLRQVIRETLDSGQLKRGASTIPMQLAKVRFLGHQKTFVRKFNQLLMAYLIELKYTKEEILFAYLEGIPFAPGVVGLQNAAKTFFSVSPLSLSREQSLRLVLSLFDPLDYNLAMANIPRHIRSRGLVLQSRIKEFSKTLKRELDGSPSLKN